MEKGLYKKHVYNNVYHIKLDKTLPAQHVCIQHNMCVTYTYTRNNSINKQNPHTDDENVYKKCIQKNAHTTKVYAEKGKQQKVYHRNLMYTLS